MGPRVVDALLGVAVTGTLAAVISARQGGTHPPDLPAYAWAVGLGALMLARRAYPRTVVILSALSLFAYYAAGYPAVGVAVPLAAALFSAAESARTGTAAATAAGVLTVSLAFRLREGDDVAFVLGYDLITHVTLMAAAIALGDAVRSRRTQRDQQRELARRDAQAQAREERLAIARDLHDSLGHTVAVISLHAEVARESLDPGDPVAGPALLRVRAAASDALRELRTTVALLRGDGNPPGGSLADVPAILDTARAAGFDVLFSCAAGAVLPAAVDAAAYRIIQEGVTNVVRHADAGQVAVEVHVAGGVLRLVVADDGPFRRDFSPGNGLNGLAERARAVGGRVRARHEKDGFVLEAALPLDGRP